MVFLTDSRLHVIQFNGPGFAINCLFFYLEKVVAYKRCFFIGEKWELAVELKLLSGR
jgi:hypothetical protein